MQAAACSTAKLCDQTLQERTEFFFTEPSIAYDAAHRKRVDGVVPGNRDDPDTVRHHYVLGLPGDTEARFLQSPYRVLMVDPWNARHVLRSDLNFADDRAV